MEQYKFKHSESLYEPSSINIKFSAHMERMLAQVVCLNASSRLSLKMIVIQLNKVSVTAVQDKPGKLEGCLQAPEDVLKEIHN